MARLSPFIQGVQFELSVDGRTVSAVIVAETLKHRFGADDTPASWLRAFEANEVAIMAVAFRQFRAGRTAAIVNDRSDGQVAHLDGLNLSRAWCMSSIARALPDDHPWRVAPAILAALMRYLEWLAALPSAAWSSHAPRGWTVVIAVGGVLWLFAPRGMPGRPLGVVWMLPTALLLPPGTSEGGVRITVLDVGQGLAVFVATARHALVYDTGPRFNDAVDAGGRIVVPFLRAAGVARLDALIVSHADSDHAGGARSILNAVPVARFVSSLPGDHVVFTDAPRDMPAARCNTDMRWKWDGVRFALLHPLPSNYDEPQRKGNDLSCVLRIESLGGNVLLTGDIEALTETELLQRDARGLAADVLVVPHHGSKTSSTPAFIAAVAPRVALVAAGERHRVGHPRGEILARYLRAGAAWPRTDLQGAITVTLEPGRALAVEAERDRHRRYWYDIAP